MHKKKTTRGSAAKATRRTDEDGREKEKKPSEKRRWKEA